MAESPLDRLKRLAAEKKAAVAQPVANAEAASGEAGASAVVLITEDTSEDIVQIAKANELRELVTENSEANLEARMQISLAALKTESKLPEANPALGPISNHPLAMDFAELEAALLASDPEFKTILRKIHRHLGQEAELVTQMTEQEIQMVVQGLIVFANAEVVAPAAAKSAKAKIAAAKKQVISADDL